MSNELELSNDSDIVNNKELVLQTIRNTMLEKWITNEYIIDKIKDTIDNAVIVNNQWISYKDSKSILKWIEMILKLVWIDIWKKMTVKIFNVIPDWKDKLEY